MNNKCFSLCLAIVAMLLMPASLQATTVFFKYVCGTEMVPITSSDYTVSVYQNGRSVGYADYSRVYDDNRNYSYIFFNNIDDSCVGQTVAYISPMGHRGEIVVADSMTVELQCTKLTVNAKDSEGNAMSDNSIRVTGTTSTSRYTNSDGQATLYVVPGEYSWSWSYGEGTIDLSTNQTLELTAKIEKVVEIKTYRVSFYGHYGNYPVNTRYCSIFKEGVKYKTTSYDYAGRYSYFDLYYAYCNLPAGTYQMFDDYGGYGGEFTVNADTTIYLDYHKVTFTSKSGTMPNANQQISVRLKDNNSYNSTSETTDNKGIAEMYLLPGTYVWSAAGGSGEFTVGNADMTQAIETATVTFNIQCEDVSSLRFYLNNVTYQLSDNNTLTYGCMPGSEITLIIRDDNGSRSQMTVTANGNETVNVKLHSLQFTSNQTGGDNIVYVRNDYDGFSASWNKKYYLIEGDYRYNLSDGAYTDFTLNEDMTIEKTLSEVTVTLMDTNGNLVSNEGGPKIDDRSCNSSSNGTYTFYCLPGKYTLSWGKSYYYSIVQQELTVNGDTQVTLTIPAEISFTIEDPGKFVDYESNFWYVYDESGNSVGQFSSYRNGYKATGRFFSNRKYQLSNSGYGGKIHGWVNFTDGCTITLGKISVTSEGMGLAFPMESWDAVSTYYVIVGSPVRLSAVPVGNENFTKWTINGKDYTEPMMEFKTTAANTTAKAVFGGNVPSKIRNMQTNTSLSFDENYVTLPSQMEGVARIFTLDGKQVKRMGVASDQIGIYDLPAGAYILSFEHDGGVINAQFLKE